MSSPAASATSGLFDVLAQLDLVRMLPPPGEPPRASALLAGLVRRGVPISFGSDAHRRAQLGLGWDEARALLGGLGAGRVAVLRGRRAHGLPI